MLQTIEEFTKTHHMMNIGPFKGAVIDAEIRKKQPLIMAELGGFTGYSAVRFASVQRDAAGDNKSHYYSFEFNPTFAERIREVCSPFHLLVVVEVELSGRVCVDCGLCRARGPGDRGRRRVRRQLPRAGRQDGRCTSEHSSFFLEHELIVTVVIVQIYFIDHAKEAYLSDAKLIFESGTLAPGSILAADNVVRPGAPDYLEFIENHSKFTTTRHDVPMGWSDYIVPDLSIATYLG